MADRQKVSLRFFIMKVSNLRFLVDIAKHFPARIFTHTVKRVVCAILPFDEHLLLNVFVISVC